MYSGVLYEHWLNLILVGQVKISDIECEVAFIIQSQTSTVQPLKFRKKEVSSQIAFILVCQESDMNVAFMTH